VSVAEVATRLYLQKVREIERRVMPRRAVLLYASQHLLSELVADSVPYVRR